MNHKKYLQTSLKIALGLALVSISSSAFAAAFGQSVLLWGDGTAGYLGDGAPISATSRFNAPADMVRGISGVTYIADNNCIRMVSASGMLSTLIGTCGAAAGYVEGSGSTARFSSLRGLALDETNNILYVTDSANHRIRKINLATGISTLIAGDGTSGTTEGAGISARFNTPRSIELSADRQTLYVADTNNHRVRSIDLSTNAVSLLASVTYPMDISLDPSTGFLYVAQNSSGPGNTPTWTTASNIYKIEIATARVSLVYNMQDPTMAALSSSYGYGQPYSVLFDASSNALYVTASMYTYQYWNTSGSYIARINLATNTAVYIAGNIPYGATTTGYAEGVATSARLAYYAGGLSLDAANKVLYFADTGNNRVRTVDLSTYATPSVVASQYAYVWGTVISTGSSLPNSRSLVLSFTASTSEHYQNALIDVEVKPIGTAFDGSSGYYVSTPVTLGSAASLVKNITVGIPHLSVGTSYHWRYRIRDAVNANMTTWANYGWNLETETDFTVPAKGKAFQTNVASQGSETTLWAVQDTARSSSGVIYTVSSSTHCVRKFQTQSDFYVGNSSLVAGLCGTSGYAEGQGNTALFNTPTGIALDETNNLLYVADTGNHRIRKINLTTGISTLVAGDGTSGYIEGAGISARFASPRAVELSADRQTLYVADTYNNRIRKIDLSTSTVSLLAGNAGGGNTDGVGAAATFIYPMDISLDPATGALYVVQNHAGPNSDPIWTRNLSSVRKIDTLTSRVSLVYNMQDPSMAASIHSSYGYGQPYSVLFDASSNALYVTASMYTYQYWNTSGSYIARINLATNTAVYIAGNIPYGATTTGYAEGVATSARLAYYAGGLSLDAANKVLYFADTGNNRVRTVDLRHYDTPELLSFALYRQETGISPIAVGGINSFRETRLEYQFRDLDTADGIRIDTEIKPLAIPFDETNLVTPHEYITYVWTVYTKSWIVSKPIFSYGQSYHIRYRITDMEGYTTGWVSYGANAETEADIIIWPEENTKTSSVMGNGDSSIIHNFLGQTDIIKSGDSLYVLGNHCIRKIPKDFSLELINNNYSGTLVAGLCGTSGYAEGQGNTALFNTPTGIALDETNNLLYVADTGNHRIRKINLTTGISTLVAGDGTSGYIEGAGISARFASPRAVELSADRQTLYVADTYNNRIRKIDLSTSTVSLLAGNAGGGNTDGVGAAATFIYPMDISLDPATGALYVVQNQSGPNSTAYSYNTLSAIRKIDTATARVSLVYNMQDPSIAVSNPTYAYGQPYSVLFDASSNSLYVTASMYTRWVWNTEGSYVFRLSLSTNTPVVLAWSIPYGINSYWYAEGVSPSSRLALYPGGLSIDAANKVLYFADTGNNRVREVNLKNYQNPSLATMQIKNIENDMLTLWGTLRSRTLRLDYSVRDLDNVDLLETEIEIKKVTEPFDGLGTYIAPALSTVKWTDSSSYYIMSGNELELGASYHVRLRARDQGNMQSPWVYYGGNLDLWISGATYSDADFIVPANDSGYFQTQYLVGNGAYTQERIAAQSKYAVKPSNFSLNNPRMMDRDQAGNVYFTETESAGTAIKKMSTDYPYTISRVATLSNLTSFTIDRPNNLLYVTEGNAIYRLNLAIANPPFVHITGGNAAGYGEGYPAEVKFSNIYSIVISPDGKTLYIADLNNHRVRKLNLDAATSDYLSVSLLVGSWIASNVAGTYQSASIVNPRSLEISQDGKYLFVANTSHIFKITIAQNLSSIFRNYGGYYMKRDRTGEYLYVSFGASFFKIHIDEIYRGSDGYPLNNGSYLEGIAANGGARTGDVNGMVEVGGKLYFIDGISRIRSLIVPNASDASVTPVIPLSAIQKESNNSTTVAIGGVTKSQTMYLGVTMRHPYKFTHVRPEIDIKPIGMDFDAGENPTGTVLGAYQYYVGTDVSVNALITKDLLKPSIAYHWRARVVDTYGNKGPWAYANSNVETDPDFQTGPTGIGQTNLIMGTLSVAEATGFFPLVQLPAFNYSLTDKDTFGNISKIYFINGACLAYFDYLTYRQTGNAYQNFIKNVSCDGSFASVNGPLKFNEGKTFIYYHSATQVYKYDLFTKAVTLLAGAGSSGYLDGLPTSSYFNGITDVMILRNLDTTYNEKCMLVSESGNADIRIVPIAGPGFNCKGTVGADNGYVEKWKDIAGLTCMRQTNDTTRLSVNGGVISMADRVLTSVVNLPCMNDSLSADETTLYYFNSFRLYRATLTNFPASVTKISGNTSGYLEGDEASALFSSVNTIVYDPSFNSLFVNDAGKFREVFLNTSLPPGIASISPWSGKTGDQVTLSGTLFGADPGYSNRSSQNYGVLFNGVPATPDDFISWSNNSIVVKVPAGATTGPVRVTNLGGMSNGMNFTVTNNPIINYIVPTSAKAGQAVQVYGKYFWTKGTGSYVYFMNASGAYIAANIIGWADGRVDILVPAQAATGQMKVTSGYGDSNLTEFTMLTGSPPSKPLPLSPANGAVGQALSPVLTTQDFVDLDSDGHSGSWWDVRESSQTFANPVYTSGMDTLNKTSVTVPPNGFKYNTTYYWRVKFLDSRGDWSEWSEQFQFKTTDGGTTSNNLPPVKPTNTSPAHNTVDIDPNASLLLSASAFMDGETYASVTGATVHDSSSWQVRSFDGTYGSSVFERLSTSAPLTNLTIPAGTLVGNRTYCWHVSYRDLGGSSSPYSAETCFKTKNAAVVVWDPGTGNTGGTGNGGGYPQTYDAPVAPANFSLVNNTSAHSVALVSNAYVDSNTDTLTGSNDKLQTTEWQVLLFSGSTGINLTSDGNGFVTDARIASVSFGNAKKFRELRENCSDENCLLSKMVAYSELGAVGTYLVRVRHMDQHSTWGNFSSVKAFEVSSLPSLSVYMGNLRSIANLSVKTISGDSAPFAYAWTGSTNLGAGTIVAIASQKCWGQTIPASYSIYSYCLYDSGSSTVYGYVSGITSDSLRFEPTKKGVYNFTVTVTNPTTSKSLSKIIPVTVQ